MSRFSLLSLFLSFVLFCEVKSTDEQGFDVPAFNNKIKHVIAIMLENRAFDHALGFLRLNRTDVDGCLPNLPNCSNPLNPSDTNGPFFSVGENAVYIQPGDPDHSVGGTTEQAYGILDNNNPSNWPPPMDGFIASYNNFENKQKMNDSGEFIMQCFTPETLPILNTLADDFAVIDHWFCDVPGPTDPNRVYSWLATSAGLADNTAWRLILGFREMSIFEMLDKYWNNSINGRETWRLYYDQVPTPVFVDYCRRHPLRWHWMDRFFDDLKTGNLPLFSWLDPAYSNLKDFPASDEHPDHDVTYGEKLLKKVYEEVRNSSIWNETLIIIFYDEHGGFFDHVPPPKAPSPDNKTGYDVQPPFYFNRVGVRVPAVFISPYIKKGYVPPTPNSQGSQYTHSSVVHTLREQFCPNFPPFTARDEWSLTFENLISLDEPRTDCPMTLPNVPAGSSRVHPYYQNENHVWRSGYQKPNDFVVNLVKSAAQICNLNNHDLSHYLENEDAAGRFLMECVEKFMKTHGDN